MKKQYYGKFVGTCKGCETEKILRSKKQGLCGNCESQARYGTKYWRNSPKTEPRHKEACAICGELTKLVVDHNHALGCHPKTGSCDACRRGLLCASCNVGLGHFKDSPALLLGAQKYLLSYVK